MVGENTIGSSQEAVFVIVPVWQGVVLISHDRHRRTASSFTFNTLVPTAKQPRDRMSSEPLQQVRPLASLPILGVVTQLIEI